MTATEYGSSWLAEIAEIARGLGHSVYELAREQATPENMYEALESFKPNIVIAMSHGNARQFSGQNARIVFTACQNDEKMSGTQSFYLSCLMGQELAPSMVSKSATSVAAFVTEFVWMIDPEYSSREDYINDPKAFPFRRAIRESCRAVLRGGSWQSFYDTFVRMCNLGVSEWWNSEDAAAPQIVAALEQDRDSLVVYGNKTISPSPSVTISAALPLGIALTLISVSL